MKKLFTACMMCFSMFCAIPCPFHGWDVSLQPLTTLFLPMVGAWIGALWALLSWILNILSVPPILTAALLCAFPFIITGHIHFDGFLDVTDAVKSWRVLDERRRILKDPHVGSFAVISGILLVMLQFALFASVQDSAHYFTLLIIPITSRTIAGLCVTILRPISVSEYAGVYRQGIKQSHIVIFIVILVLTTLFSFLFLGRYALATLAVIAGYLIALYKAFRSLDGMSGDISGYSLVIGELCGIAVYALL